MLWIAAVIAIVLVARTLRFDGGTRVSVPLLGVAIPELCGFRRFFGIACPGCGITRSFILASRCELARAWTMNPAGTLLFGSLVLSIPYRLGQMWLAKRSDRRIRSAWWELGVLVTISAVMMGNWLLSLFHNAPSS